MKTIVGGTFDRLHTGHKKLLDTASMMAGSDRLTIGLMSDATVSSKQHIVNSFNKRAKGIEEYLLHKKDLNFSVVEIDGIVPSDIDDVVDWSTLECIVVSTETYSGGIEFNNLRSQMKFPQLLIVVLPQVNAYDGKRISSTRIRNNEIDTEGNKILA